MLISNLFCQQLVLKPRSFYFRGRLILETLRYLCFVRRHLKWRRTKQNNETYRNPKVCTSYLKATLILVLVLKIVFTDCVPLIWLWATYIRLSPKKYIFGWAPQDVKKWFRHWLVLFFCFCFAIAVLFSYLPKVPTYFKPACTKLDT